MIIINNLFIPKWENHSPHFGLSGLAGESRDRSANPLVVGQPALPPELNCHQPSWVGAANL